MGYPTLNGVVMTDVRLTAVLACGCYAGGWAAPSLWTSALFVAFSRAFLAATIVGVAVFVAFFCHIVPVVFSRVAVLDPAPMWNLFLMTKPLELVFRFVTAPLRVLPDACIIGEVRTTLTLVALSCITHEPAHSTGLPHAAPCGTAAARSLRGGHFCGCARAGNCAC